MHGIDAGIGPGPHCRGTHGIVGFVGHHGEDGEARRLQRSFEQGELGEQFGGCSLARLVAAEQVVSERLDYPVGSHAHMGGTVSQ